MVALARSMGSGMVQVWEDGVGFSKAIGAFGRKFNLPPRPNTTYDPKPNGEPVSILDGYRALNGECKALPRG